MHGLHHHGIHFSARARIEHQMFFAQVREMRIVLVGCNSIIR